jgi:inorganic pyrophosphatase
MEIAVIMPIDKGNLVNVIIETPRGSRNKFAYDPVCRTFRLKKTLPVGAVFPFDFGFIPNTLAQDGDPLDILVIMEEPTYPGCLVECRLFGILEANQKEKDGKSERNDRLVAVSAASVIYGGITEISQLNKNMVKEIEQFFIDYNKQDEKKFSPIGWKNSKKALQNIKKLIDKNYKKAHDIS